MPRMVAPFPANKIPALNPLPTIETIPDCLQFPSRSLDTFALPGKSQTTPSFHFLNSRPIRRYTSFPPAGKETRFPSFSESETPISKLYKHLFLVTVHRDEWIQSRGKSLREERKTNERRKKLNFGTVSDFEML